MHKLTLTKPAHRWVDALPVGNGITGAMIYGGKRKEILAINDTSFWSGYPKDFDRSESAECLGKARELIFAGKYAEAEKYVSANLYGNYSEAYLPLGYVDIKFSNLSSRGYKRELDLSNAIHTVYSDGVVREAFCSYPDKVLCYSIKAQSEFGAVITSHSKVKSTFYTDGEKLIVRGNAPGDCFPPYVPKRKGVVYDGKGMAFSYAVSVKTDGITTAKDGKLIIKGAQNVSIFVVTATGFVKYNTMPSTDSLLTARKCVEALDGLRSYEDIRAKHIEDYSALYSVQSLSLCSDSDLSASELVKQAKNGDPQNALCELLYNFGKYLTVSASRIGGEPMNLQGIWNDDIRPPWSSNYTININTEMNYWGASECGLTACVEPFVDYVADLAERGKKTARVNYGARGFCANHNADLWRHTAPVIGAPQYMFAPLCGIWMANEAYSHYCYGGLENKASKVKAMMEEGSRFVLDFLVEHDGELVPCPSTSPENYFNVPGGICAVDYGTAFDLGVIRQVFTNTLEISDDEELKTEIRNALERLRPFTVGKNGINEWHEFFETTDKGHRHFSPLYALYPGRVINYYKDRELVDAMHKLYEYRLDNARLYHGWSGAWAICLAARFRDSDRAERVIRNMMAHSIFPNLLDMHPPRIFQIDGNYGFVAGVNELLATVDDGVLELLPALPKMWQNGSMRGLRVYGGGAVDFRWENGVVTEVTLRGGNLKLRNKNLSNNIKVSGIEILEA